MCIKLQNFLQVIILCYLCPSRHTIANILLENHVAIALETKPIKRNIFSRVKWLSPDGLAILSMCISFYQYVFD